MIVQRKPLSEITEEAIDILSREIGIVNTIRFINQFSTGYGNYTEERDQLFAHLTLEDIVAGIEEIQKQASEQ